jgi:Ca-activated chloride channel family protein
MIDVPYNRFLSKLDCAKDAAVHLMDLLKEGDKIAVVSFDDKVFVNQEPQEIKEHLRNRIRGNIQNIQSGGCTNISGALMTAFDLFTKSDREQYNCKIVLLSDGEANVGYRREDEFIPLMNKILSAGISTSTIGLGDTYDIGVMEAISGNCAGSFHHISDAMAIKDIFMGELRTTQDIVCKDVTVKLALPDMVAFKPNFNNYNEDILKDNICVKLGNLYGSKDLYYEFSVLDENAEKICIAVTVEYENTAGAKTTASMMKELLIINDDEDDGEDADVIDELFGIIKDRYMYNATKAATVNDFDTASLYLGETRDTMDSITTSYSCCSASYSKAYSEVEAFSNAVTTQTSDSLRKTFEKSSKKMRNN